MHIFRVDVNVKPWVGHFVYPNISFLELMVIFFNYKDAIPDSSQKVAKNVEFWMNGNFSMKQLKDRFKHQKISIYSKLLVCMHLLRLVGYCVFHD